MNFIIDIIDKFYKFLRIDIYFFISLISLIIATGIFYLRIEEKKKTKIFLIFFIILISMFAFRAFTLSRMQYFIWLNHPISKYLIPPYATSINYFLDYVFFHFWRDLFFRLLGALGSLFIIIFINFLLKRDVFYDDEKILMIYITLLFFFPYNLIIIFLGFFMLLLNWVIKLVISFIVASKTDIFKERLSFRNYWLILVWICFLLQPFFLTNYNFLKYRPF